MTSADDIIIQHTWLGSDPDRICPVIMPGMDTMPTTFIWFMMGVSATLTQRWIDACVASHLFAPIASSCSILSLPAKQQKFEIV